MAQYQCVLRCLKIGLAKKLPDIKIPLGKKVIGRSEETQIEDAKVSREHCKYTLSM